MKLKVGIIDYGIGNWNSIRCTLRKLKFKVEISNDPNALENKDLIILPGVGAFKPAMHAINQDGLDKFIISYALKKKPILGICLGMQLLANSSTENGSTSGLKLIPGNVKSIGVDNCHIGWNSINKVKNDDLFSLTCNELFYFNHSYAFENNKKYVVTTTKFKDKIFPSIVRLNNIIGLQFHPEKSQISGRKLLNSVINSTCYD